MCKIEDINYMRLALDEANKGIGYTSPNPVVGCVVVKDNTLIGTGYHQSYGTPHAEVNALANCRERGYDPAGATLYVTLEPCCHVGKTPPCTQAILDANISRVVIATQDPNPKAGGGYQLLLDAGVSVTLGILEEEARTLNEIFFHYITTGMPFVLQKYAMTLDGKIATYTGASKYISGAESLARVHFDRHKHMAIMVGIGTVLADDPLLTCRFEGHARPVRNPIRVICDTRLRTPSDAQLVTTAKDVPTVIATTVDDPGQYAFFQNQGVGVIQVPLDEKKQHLDLVILMKKLAELGIDSVLLEGGSELHWSALDSGIVSKINAYIAPKLFGGTAAPGPIGGLGVAIPDQAFTLTHLKTHVVGQDLMVEAIPSKKEKSKVLKNNVYRFDRRSR